jgi:hypothetical protein
MKSVSILASIMLFLLCSAAAAQIPNFDYPSLIPNPQGYIVSGNSLAVPCFGDWDDDGDADLLVGVMYDGYIYFYENVSSETLPQFGPGVLLEADGELLSVSYA